MQINGKTSHFYGLGDNVVEMPVLYCQKQSTEFSAIPPVLLAGI